jgi:hypothetical protein
LLKYKLYMHGRIRNIGLFLKIWNCFQKLDK